MTETIPIPRELVERALILIGAWRIDTHSTKPEVWPGSPINLESQAVLEGIAAALRSALTQQAEGAPRFIASENVTISGVIYGHSAAEPAVPVAEAMEALIAAWNRLTKLHGWTRAWEPEPGDDGWIPAHEQMQRAINALISAQPSGQDAEQAARVTFKLDEIAAIRAAMKREGA
jgi:hypothetical protein